MTLQEFLHRYNYDSQRDCIGEGGFGSVYRAYDNVLDREAAIKIAAVRHVSGKTFSLKEECEMVLALPSHANIARYEAVYSYTLPTGTSDFAVMQYYPDGNLKSLMAQGTLSLTQKEEILFGLLDGLEYLHAHKIIHRDLKPANILMAKRMQGGEVVYVPKIADFGLSKVADSQYSQVSSSFAGGTLEYSSPEQLKGLPLRYNTDLWSWAVIAYELLTGQKLFQVPTNSSAYSEGGLVEQIFHEDIQSKLAQLPEPWQRMLAACLEREPEQRVREVSNLQSLLVGSSDLDTDATKVNPATSQEKKQEQDVSPKQTQQPIQRKSKSSSQWVQPKNIFIGLGIAALVGISVMGIAVRKGSTPPPNNYVPIASESKDSTSEEAPSFVYKEVIPCEYDYADSFSEGLALVKHNGQCGFIGDRGGAFFFKDYTAMGSFSQGLASVLLNGSWGFINKEGERVISCQYDNVYAFSQGVAQVKLDGKWGIINKQGEKVVSFLYDDMAKASEGLIGVKLNNKWGFINKEGEKITPLKYDEIYPFSEGLAQVKIDDHWGFINKEGREVISCKYEETISFSEGLIGVKLNGRWGYINRHEDKILSCEYDNVYPFYEGLAKVRLGNKYGFIDKEGKEVVPCEYDDAYSFKEGRGRVCRNGKWGFIGKKKTTST